MHEDLVAQQQHQQHQQRQQEQGQQTDEQPLAGGGKGAMADDEAPLYAVGDLVRPPSHRTQPNPRRPCE